MAPHITGRTKPTKPKKQQRATKRKRDDVDVEKLEQQVQDLDPKGSYTSFSDLPLSLPTQEGLKACHFTTLTPIQARAVPLALHGSDILGAAKTGSGKTLAFIVPVLENLYRKQCVGQDAGLGAMIIAPTRELAIQIFDVLVKIGRKGHLFSAGLVIGGKSLQEEQNALARMNIVVCTPGRMLQHLSQTALFSVDNVQMLVLDEADRILDMGFQRDLDAILEYLPKDRQTLLFSATQTKRVSDLARLSLRDPEYVSTSEQGESATPKSLQQNYVLTPLPDKLDTLWSFIQTCKKSKIIVFLSSGKQVRFVFEAFRHMQPGIPLLHLHGRQKQTARLDITTKFSHAQHSCMFATDVAARGLDFPAVDWVVQLDAPEDADTYIHRVGRTARYERDGKAVLFLDPSEEEGMLSRLEAKKVPIERISVKQKKQQSIKPQLQNMCFKDPTLKYLGQKAFASYVRSIHIQKDKEVFKLEKLNLEEYAASLGLPGAPKIKFIAGDDAKARKNAPRAKMVDSEDESEGEKEEKKKPEVRTKYDRMFERKNQDVLADHYSKMINDDDIEALDGTQMSDDDLFSVKRRIPVQEEKDDSSDEEHTLAVADMDLPPGAKAVHIPGAKDALIIDSKRREKLLKSKKKLLKFKESGQKLVFDDDGNAHQIYELEDEDAFKAKGTAEEQRQKFLEEEAQRVRESDLLDKALAKEKKRAKKEKRKEREREENASDEEEGGEGETLPDASADFKKFLAGSEDGSEGEEDDEQPKKKQKKWFEGEGKRTDMGREEAAPETLADLEALAAGLLG
ncbi:P-loop containing nucleoside triphosphate hydrolase protein [Aureobasidium pullulans]|uniref:ATP-dependent RNA helicase n=1 Tax=Aureobasidium pullulans TaxID=5580 RepID=A0A4T0CCI1_AURPU|nr:P-loop containing nucleoside triphosphate hydrolase protein [Aureobasidium pullulans]THZ23516.1 P-loop containing nucleoside triphosphate hydrolase protein [Aureobasidium pullulans]TIA45188.1 P-loop containing nucleoside triphosphate hydrolase protein [Aureobasidium pullulans]